MRILILMLLAGCVNQHFKQQDKMMVASAPTIETTSAAIQRSIKEIQGASRALNPSKPDDTLFIKQLAVHSSKLKAAFTRIKALPKALQQLEVAYEKRIAVHSNAKQYLEAQLREEVKAKDKVEKATAANSAAILRGKLNVEDGKLREAGQLVDNKRSEIASFLEDIEGMITAANSSVRATSQPK